MKRDHDKFILRNWPKLVPQECSKLKNDQDCLERGLKHPCDSCKTFETLSRRFDNHDPRTVPYMTIYDGKTVIVKASDKYNAAANRISKQTRKRWVCSSTGNVSGQTLFVVTRGNQTRHVAVW